VLELRTFDLADGGSVVAARGDLDALGTSEIEAVVGRCRGRVVVNLTETRLVDLEALDQLVDRVRVTYVAVRPLRDALELIGLRRPIEIVPTLAAALG
jgi:hypothetical protein